MLLIPALDLLKGRCVRLREGDFATQASYPVEPASLLARYQGLGARWVHIVDLDGARDGVPTHASLIEQLARHPVLCLQVGGGIRSAAHIERFLSAGVARVVVGSLAVTHPQTVADWIQSFGVDRICIALDVRIGPNGEPQVHTHGWTRNSVVSLWDAIDAFPADTVKHVLCTDIGRDGTLRGPNIYLYRLCLSRRPQICWQASGGIRSGADLASLAKLGLTAAVSGTALLEERISIKELRPFLPDALFPVSTCG